MNNFKYKVFCFLLEPNLKVGKLLYWVEGDPLTYPSLWILIVYVHLKHQTLLIGALCWTFTSKSAKEHYYRYIWGWIITCTRHHDLNMVSHASDGIFPLFRNDCMCQGKYFLIAGCFLFLFHWKTKSWWVCGVLKCCLFYFIDFIGHSTVLYFL